MIRPAYGATAALAFLAAYSPAMAQGNPLEKLRSEISARCHPLSASQQAGFGGAPGALSTQELGAALFAEDVIVLTSEYRGRLPTASDLAQTAFIDNPPGANRDNLLMLRRLVETWTNPRDARADDWLPFDDGGVETRRIDGASVPHEEAKAVLTAILEGDASRYVFLCTPPEPAPSPTPQPEPAPGTTAEAPSPVTRVGGGFAGPRLAIAQTPGDLAAPLADKEFAEFAFIDNQEANKQTYSAHATFGLNWGDFTLPPLRDGGAIRLQPISFVQLERSGGDGVAADAEVNNLSFGAQIGGVWQTGAIRNHYFSFGARYLTDDSFESEGWSAALEVTPDIVLPGNDIPYRLTDRLNVRWLVTGVLDYIDITDPGQKVKLATAPEFTRIGYDAALSTRYFLDSSEKRSLSLTMNYKLRDDISSGGGDAQMFTSAFLFEPTPYYAYGVAYERGEALDSLEFVESWKFTFKLRQ